MNAERKEHGMPALVALVLAWLAPGAGHAYMGRPVQAVIIFVVVGATFWAGVAIGGVMTVDYESQRWWFLSEMFTGVHGLVAWRRQQARCDSLAEGISKGPMREVDRELKNRRKKLRGELGDLEVQLAELNQQKRSAETAEEKDGLDKEIREVQYKRQQVREEIRFCGLRLRDLRREFIDQAVVDGGLALVAPTATVAYVYAGVAGLLNLMCMFDAVMLAVIRANKEHGPAARREEQG